MHWWQIYVAAWGIAAVLSAALTYLCRHLAPHVGLLDRPLQEKHKGHKQAVPVLGGVAMCLAWLAVIAGGLFVSGTCRGLLSHRLSAYLPGIQTALPQLLWIACGATGLVVLGLVDDRRPLHALTKFAGQFAIAGAVACYGVRVTLFWSVPLVTWMITTFWILLIINALNFFDNMDGLAGGTAAIAAFMFAFTAATRGQNFVAALAWVTCGVATGFLLHNRPPASIFMGDAGSQFLGYMLAVIGALTTFYTPTESLTPAPLLIPLLVLGLPIFDAGVVVLMRLHRGQPIYVGDHTHISHRFTDLGLSRAQAVLVVYLIVFALGAGGVALLWLPPAGTVLILLQSAALLALVSLIQYFVNDGKSQENNSRAQLRQTVGSDTTNGNKPN